MLPPAISFTYRGVTRLNIPEEKGAPAAPFVIRQALAAHLCRCNEPVVFIHHGTGLIDRNTHIS